MRAADGWRFLFHVSSKISLRAILVGFSALAAAISLLNFRNKERKDLATDPRCASLVERTGIDPEDAMLAGIATQNKETLLTTSNVLHFLLKQQFVGSVRNAKNYWLRYLTSGLGRGLVEVRRRGINKVLVYA